MKKVFAMIAVVAFSCGAFAQQEPIKKDSSKTKMKKTEMKKTTKTTTKTKTMKDSTNHK